MDSVTVAKLPVTKVMDPHPQQATSGGTEVVYMHSVALNSMRGRHDRAAELFRWAEDIRHAQQNAQISMTIKRHFNGDITLSELTTLLKEGGYPELADQIERVEKNHQRLATELEKSLDDTMNLLNTVRKIACDDELLKEIRQEK